MSIGSGRRENSMWKYTRSCWSSWRRLKGRKRRWLWMLYWRIWIRKSSLKCLRTLMWVWLWVLTSVTHQILVTVDNSWHSRQWVGARIMDAWRWHRHRSKSHTHLKKPTNPDPSLSVDLASSHSPVRLPSCQCCIGPLAHYLGMSPPHDQYGRTGLIQTFWQSSITIKYTLVINGYPKIGKTKPLSTMGHSFLYVFFFYFIIYAFCWREDYHPDQLDVDSFTKLVEALVDSMSFSYH